MRYCTSSCSDPFNEEGYEITGKNEYLAKTPKNGHFALNYMIYKDLTCMSKCSDPNYKVG